MNKTAVGPDIIRARVSVEVEGNGVVEGALSPGRDGGGNRVVTVQCVVLSNFLLLVLNMIKGVRIECRWGNGTWGY